MTKARVLVDLVKKEEYILTPYKETTIGKLPDNDIQTNPLVETVSRHHATVYNEDGSVYIWDNKSKNGTYIYEKDKNDREWITKRTLVPLNFTIVFGGTYKMRLEERDLKAEKSNEEKLRNEDTMQIEDEESLINRSF